MQVRRGSKVPREKTAKSSTLMSGACVSQLLLRNNPSHVSGLKQIFIPHDFCIGGPEFCWSHLGLPVR